MNVLVAVSDASLFHGFRIMFNFMLKNERKTKAVIIAIATSAEKTFRIIHDTIL